MSRLRLEDWLSKNALSEYLPLFRQHEIILSDLPLLSDDDIAELGLPLGPRKRLIAAIASLRETSTHDDPLAESCEDEIQAQGTAERRQLTVMFCDLVGSTELSVRLDPEELSEITRAYQERCKAVIDKYDGYVARYMGDGVLVYFGYPRAHEDDAIRSVHAGFEICAGVGGSVGDTGAQPDVELHVRVGIATGPVVVGGTVGEGASRESTASGETPNLAARLQAIAGPDQVIVDASTQALTESMFRFEARGDQQLKGFGQAVQAWRVVEKRRSGKLRPDADDLDLAGMVGRTEELALLLRRWEDTSEKEGQVVLITGEPGIGKSRIIKGLQEKLSAEQCDLVSFSCSPYQRSASLWPFVTDLERKTAIPPRSDVSVRREQLRALVSTFATDVREAMSAFASLLSIDIGDEFQVSALSAQEKRDLTLRLLVEQIVGLNREIPVVVFFEDAHWSDPTSLDLLERLIQRIMTLPVLLIVTARPEFTPGWQDFSHFTGLTLNKMSRREVRSLATKVAGNKKLPDEVVSEILQRTDGVPLYVEELTKLILESGHLSEEDDTFTLRAPLPDLEIPVSLKASLMARLDRTGTARETAQIASVIGRHFGFRLLSGVSPQGPETVSENVQRLIDSGMIFLEDSVDDLQYSFKHALIRDVAYESLLRSRRFKLHEGVGDALAAEFINRTDEVCESLAYHYSRASQPAKAVDYLSRAATKAVGRYAHKEAIDALTEALKQIDESDIEALRIQKSDLLLRLAQSHYFLGHFEDSVAILSNEPDQREVARDRQLEAEWFFWLSHMSIRLGRPDASEQAAHRAIAAAEESEAFGAKGRALGNLVLVGHFSHSADQVTKAAAWAAESSALLESTGDYYWQGMTAFYAGMARITAGDLPGALEQAKKAYEIGENISDSRLLAYALFLQGRLFADLNRFDDAVASCTEAVDIAPDPTSGAYSSAFLGYSRLLAGNFAEAEPLLRRAVEDVTEFQFRPFIGWFHILVAEALRNMGRLEEAEALTIEGMAICQDTRYAFGYGWGCRCLGRIKVAEGLRSDAAMQFKEALAAFERVDSTREFSITLDELKALTRDDIKNSKDLA